MTSGVRSGSGSHVQQATPDGICRQTLSERTGIHGNVRVLDQKARDKGFEPEKVMEIYRKAKQSGNAPLQQAMENAGTDSSRFVPIGHGISENQKYYLSLGHLGNGSNHEVSLAIRKEGDIAAVSKPISNKSSQHSNSDELQFHAALNGCPNVIQVLEYADGHCFYELADGDLHKLLYHSPQIGKAPDLILGLLNAGTQLAEKNVIHLDLKLDNVLIGKDGQPKIADFELASFVDNHGFATSNKLIGNMWYYSPERRQYDLDRMPAPPAAPPFFVPHHVGLKDNVWGFMHMICNVASKSAPGWSQLSPDFQKRFNQYEQVLSDGHQYGLQAGPEWSPEYYRTMHQYVQTYINSCPNGNLFGGLAEQTPMDSIVMKMAAVDPNQRISIQEARDLMLLAIQNPDTFVQHQANPIAVPKDPMAIILEKRKRNEEDIKKTEELIEFRNRGLPINLSFSLESHLNDLRKIRLQILIEQLTLRQNGHKT